MPWLPPLPFFTQSNILKRSSSYVQELNSFGFLSVIVLQERSPPVIDDFLYICDDAYTRDELLKMEISILRTLDFDIGFPLSYTFLRRFAQVIQE